MTFHEAVIEMIDGKKCRPINYISEVAMYYFICKNEWYRVREIYNYTLDRRQSITEGCDSIPCENIMGDWEYVSE